MENTNLLIFSNNLKKFRKIKKLTQEELAEKLNTTKTSIYNYEKGISFPSVETIYNICTVLSITPNDLLTATNDSIFKSENLISYKNNETKYDIAKVLIQCLQLEKYFSFSFKEIPDIIYPSKTNHTFCLEINDDDIVNLLAFFVEQRKTNKDYLAAIKKKLDELSHLVESKLYCGVDEEF